MKRIIFSWLFVALLQAHAAPPSMGPAGAVTQLLPDGRVFVGGTKGYIVADASHSQAAGLSRLFFLNRCRGGCTMYPGNENSTNNSSGIPSRISTVSEFRYGDAAWDDVVQCVRDIFSPYDIQITDIDPGATDHMEAIVAGYASEVQMPAGVLGVAPFSCGYIERSISYTFANENWYAGDVNEICATIGQEVAHTWGLDHELLASDPMTYLPYNQRRYFQNVDANCGEDVARACACGGSPTQNSVEDIAAVFGLDDPTPPLVTITAPTNDESVEPGFAVRATATDDTGVLRAELFIDDELTQAVDSLPFAFNAPSTLDVGRHSVKVVVYDTFSTPGEASVWVYVGEPCANNAACEDDEICFDGNCVAGPSVDGGLGSTCETSADCESSNCANDGVDAYCVSSCDVERDKCPSGFACLPSGAGGVCWPGASSEENGGCCQSGNGLASITLSLGGLLLLGRRRRS